VPPEAHPPVTRSFKQQMFLGGYMTASTQFPANPNCRATLEFPGAVQNFP